jgi:ABC-2 type transport system ATP-binding protein
VVRVGGYDVGTHPVEAKRMIGYIPDMPYLYDKLSGRDMFRFVADLFGVPWPKAERRLEYFANLFKLEHVVDKLIENYSHGMKQKLCFSMALMHEPHVIVVDEPFVGLDPQSSRIVKNLLRDECARGACVFLSTHTLDVAEELSDRMAIFKRGNIIFEGTMNELRAERAGRGGRNLEEFFLDLTAEDGDDVRLRTGMWAEGG